MYINIYFFKQSLNKFTYYNKLKQIHLYNNNIIHAEKHFRQLNNNSMILKRKPNKL